MQIDVLKITSEFYYLQMIECEAKITPFLKSHEKWIKDFNNYKEQITDKFAEIIFDYTVLVVGGEMRHGLSKASHYNPNITQEVLRTSTFYQVKEFTPTSVLRAGVSAFDCNWHCAFGGNAWKAIAQAGLLYGNVPNVAFVDHCIDLQHNNGCYFNKQDANIFRIYDKNRLDIFLGDKRNYSIDQMLSIWNIVSPIVYNLILRATNLNILSKKWLAVYKNIITIDTIQEVLNYTPIKWGETPLKNELKNSYNDNEEDENEQETYEDYQPVYFCENTNRKISKTKIA